MIDDYTEFVDAIEHAGFHTTYHPATKIGDWLVCASHRFADDHEWADSLGGNSFWVARRGNVWYLGTWVPLVYRLGDGTRLLDACLELLRHERQRAWGDFDAPFKLAYGLESVSKDEFDKL